MPRARLKDNRDSRRWPSRPASTDRHTPLALRPAQERLPPRYYNEPDAIERVCPACTLEYAEGGWQHERSCVFARTASRSGA